MEMDRGPVASFHLVVRGQCWLRSPVLESALQLDEGDFVVFPHGDRHVLAGTLDAPVCPAQELLAHSSCTPEQRLAYGGDGEATTLICGHYEYERAGVHPLVQILPGVIHIGHRDTADHEWMATATRLTALESAAQRKGSAAVVDRLAEVLLVQSLRFYIDTLDEPPGFLAAVCDPGLSSALSLMHGEPHRQWSLDDLSSAVGMSRSVFAARFKHNVGCGPIQYLALWRMHRAHELLLEENFSVSQVAGLVGYQSEFAFAKAFKRVFGIAPGAVRRGNQSAAGG